ncbi:MAG: TonB-dependent siderophore receptor [Neisseriaceae bacterium]|nr:TonB-dependent siderophore receptor [Neisseriaceae bacterium]MBP6861741.1 TonB-dependent siderophore receptor [Neisseriaceae bacterium]
MTLFNRPRHDIIISTCLLMAFGQAYGAEPDTPEAAIDDVVVVGSAGKAGGIKYKTPGSTAVISAEDIAAAQAHKLDQALQYQAGILSEPYGADNKSEWFKIRGFDASVALDGTPTAPSAFFVWLPEMYGVESVEVVKGANSMLYGSAEAGGVVNLVTKRPKSQPAGEVNVSGGNNDRRGISADYSGVLNADNSLRYRVVGQYRREDGMQNGTEMKHYYFAPSLTWDISDQTNVTFLASWQKEKGTPTNGFMPGYGSLINTPYGTIDRKTNLGEPGRDYTDREQLSFGYEFQHAFDNGWQFSQNYRYSRLDLDFLGVFAWRSDMDRLALRGYSYNKGISTVHSIDNRLRKTWTHGDLSTTVLLGTDYMRSKIDGENEPFGQTVGPIDMFNPEYGQHFDVKGKYYKIKQTQLGFYGQTQFEWDKRVLLNLGVRHDQAKNNGIMDSTRTDYDVNKTVWQGGLMYKAKNGLSPYIHYSESFRPTAGVDGYQRSYKPYEAKQTELGLKYTPSWLDGTLSVAYFDLKEKNALVADVSNVSVQAGERKNQGVELQADLALSDDWATTVSYTYSDATQDLSAKKSIRAPMVPRHMAAAQVRYTPQQGALRGLTLATGLRYVGSTTDEANFPGETVPSYTLWDAMAQYQIDRNWSLQVNARNLTDKDYVSACSFYCYYGAGRSVEGKLSYKW